MSDFQAPARKKIALDHSKLKLSTPCPSAEGKYSNLTWGLHKNNPRITVYTGDPQDANARNNNGRIQAELDLGILQMVVALMEQASKEQPGWKTQIKNFNYIYPNGKRSEKPVNTTDIWIGKDKEGLAFISLVDATNGERPVIKFPIAPNWSWCRLHHANGEPFSKEEASNLFTAGYARVIRDLYTHLAVTEFVPYEPKKQGWFNNGNNNGGGGYNRNNGGGYNSNGGNRGGNSGGYSSGGNQGGNDNSSSEDQYDDIF